MKRWGLIIGSGLASVCAMMVHTVHAELGDSEPPLLSALTTDSEFSPQLFHKPLSHAEKQHLLDAPFVIVASVDAMPEDAKRAFAVITRQREFSLANPGARYQATDYIDEPGLPLRRLVFAGTSGNTWFVHYEHGGIAHSYSVVVFQPRHEKNVRFLWGGVGYKRATNLQMLRQMIADGEFRDARLYYW